MPLAGLTVVVRCVDDPGAVLAVAVAVDVPLAPGALVVDGLAAVVEVTLPTAVPRTPSTPLVFVPLVPTAPVDVAAGLPVVAPVGDEVPGRVVVEVAAVVDVPDTPFTAVSGTHGGCTVGRVPG